MKNIILLKLALKTNPLHSVNMYEKLFQIYLESKH